MFNSLTQRYENDFKEIDAKISRTMEKYGNLFLRYSIGVVFIWFGALKPFGLSPADELVRETVPFLPGDLWVFFLGIWEIMIGVGLLIRKFNRVAILLLFLQMPGTMLPLFLLPEQCFTHIPYGLTLEGQYIIKNLILMSAGIVIGGKVRSPSTPEIKL